jgi:hypothetical protein
MVPGVIKRSKTVSSLKNAYRRHRENMVENALDGKEKETSQWRDHIRIQTHSERPYLGHWMKTNKKQESRNKKQIK